MRLEGKVMSLVWVTGSQWLQAIPEVLSEGFGGLGYGRQMGELMCTWLLVSGCPCVEEDVALKESPH